MNNLIRPVLNNITKMYASVSKNETPEFLILRSNLLSYMAECIAVMEMDFPKPEKTFKKWETQVKWLAVQRRNPHFEILYSGHWIKVYKIESIYFLALSPLTWTSADNGNRFD